MHTGLRFIIEYSMTLLVNLNKDSKDVKFADFMIFGSDHFIAHFPTEMITGFTNWKRYFSSTVWILLLLLLYLLINIFKAVCLAVSGINECLKNLSKNVCR